MKTDEGARFRAGGGPIVRPCYNRRMIAPSTRFGFRGGSAARFFAACGGPAAFFVDVAGLALFVAWTFALWNGIGVAAARAVEGQASAFLALQGACTALAALAAAVCVLCSRASARTAFGAACAVASVCAVPCVAVAARLDSPVLLAAGFCLSGMGSTVRLAWEAAMSEKDVRRAACSIACSYGAGFALFCLSSLLPPAASAVVAAAFPLASIALLVRFRSPFLREFASTRLPCSVPRGGREASRGEASRKRRLMPQTAAVRLTAACGLVFFAYGVMRTSGLADNALAARDSLAASLPALATCLAIAAAYAAFVRMPAAAVYLGAAMLVCVAALPQGRQPWLDALVFAAAVAAADTVKYEAWFLFVRACAGRMAAIFVALAGLRCAQWAGSTAGQALALFGGGDASASAFAVLVSVIAALLFLVGGSVFGALIPEHRREVPDAVDEKIRGASDRDEDARPDEARDAIGAFAAQALLTPRETEVFALWVRGHTGAYIEKTLFISKSTVKTHIGHIYEKTGTSNREELLAAFDEFSRRPS